MEIKVKPYINYSIRDFEAADQISAKNLILSGLGEYFPNIDEFRNQDLNDIEAAYLRKGHKFFLACDDERIIGTVGLYLYADEAEIVRMSVDKAYRRYGIASKLFKTALQTVKTKNIKTVKVLTDPPWHGAIGF